MDGKSKTSHISPTTLGQMVPVESITADLLTVTDTADIPDLTGVNTAAITRITDLEEIGTDLRMVGAGDSLQTAIDAASPTGWVIIRPDYDVANDTLPITVSDRVRITGTGFRDIVAPDNSSNVFTIDFGAANEPPGPVLDTIGIQNGLRGVNVTNTRYGTLTNVAVEDADFGFDITDGATADPIGWTVSNCKAAGCVNAGFDADNGAHGLSFDNCIARNNGARGWDIDTADGVSIQGCVIELNGGHGIDVQRVEGAVISGCRFVDNDSANNRDLNLADGDNITVLGCYFEGGANNTEAITVESTTNQTMIQNCIFVDYTGQAFTLAGGQDHDIFRASHTRRNIATLVADNATRTRDHGVIVQQSLANLTGKHDSDLARDDGVNTTSGRPEIAVWDATNGVWFSQQGDTI